MRSFVGTALRAATYPEHHPTYQPPRFVGTALRAATYPAKTVVNRLSRFVGTALRAATYLPYAYCEHTAGFVGTALRAATYPTLHHSQDGYCFVGTAPRAATYRTTLFASTLTSFASMAFRERLTKHKYGLSHSYASQTPHFEQILISQGSQSHGRTCFAGIVFRAIAISGNCFTDAGISRHA